MGGTLTSVSTEISMNNSNFTMWDKGKMIVITCWTNYAKYTIFSGYKNNNLSVLKILLTRKTQLTYYMEDVLQLITKNLKEGVLTENSIMKQELFPYCICDFFNYDAIQDMSTCWFY